MRFEKEEQPRGLNGLRLCISGAAPLPVAVAERFEKLTGAKVIEGYGLSEASPVTHANLAGSCRHGTIGLPMPDTQCRIVDAEQPEREMPVGESGELLISGPQVMRGYYGDADQTRRVLTIDSDGRTWLHTGDVALMQPDGYFVILDRMKDMIIRSGLKIFPGRVEKVLQSHPGVVEAAVAWAGRRCAYADGRRVHRERCSDRRARWALFAICGSFAVNILRRTRCRRNFGLSILCRVHRLGSC